jgi:NADPH-dependent 2,4-dienoyl-CoA reductase/sulfur reductase-like enzyme
VVIVGAGPAGVAAAIALAEAGLTPLLVDENPRPGGQIYRQPPLTLLTGSAAPGSSSTRRGAALLTRFRALRDSMEYIPGAVAWGLFSERRLAVTHSGDSQLIDAEHLILATGAYEYLPPFPGWTLPGVMTPGGAQTLAKTMNVLPGRRVLVAGTGPFLLVVAEQLQRAGVKVLGVVEMAPAIEALRVLPGLLTHPGLFWEGAKYLIRLRRTGIPVYRGHLLIEANGDGGVREAVFAPCDAEGRPDRSRCKTVRVDTICAGYGFVPRIQLAQLAGCELVYEEPRGGWIPRRDGDLRTSVPGIWVAGDGGGVSGALAAEAEGSRVGLAVARRLGALTEQAWRTRSASIDRQLSRLRRFRDALERLHRLRRGLETLASPGTLVCRCEELTRAEVETGITSGGTDVRTLKVMTRLGMGPCQGLMCWPATSRMIAACSGRTVEAAGPASVRPPIGPVSVSALCGLGREL